MLISEPKARSHLTSPSDGQFNHAVVTKAPSRLHLVRYKATQLFGQPVGIVLIYESVGTCNDTESMPLVERESKGSQRKRRHANLNYSGLHGGCEGMNLCVTFNLCCSSM